MCKTPANAEKQEVSSKRGDRPGDKFDGSPSIVEFAGCLVSTKVFPIQKFADVLIVRVYQDASQNLRWRPTANGSAV